jgi:hypothetical protein
MQPRGTCVCAAWLHNVQTTDVQSDENTLRESFLVHLHIPMEYADFALACFRTLPFVGGNRATLCYGRYRVHVMGIDVRLYSSKCVEYYTATTDNCCRGSCKRGHAVQT